MNDQQYTITLTESEVIAIINLMAETPAKQGLYPLLVKVSDQAKQQASTQPAPVAE